MLHLRLLGPPELRIDEGSLEGIASKKSLALLFYLVTTRRTHSRDELASLFWYDMPDAQARKNLRNILPALRALFGSHLTITRHTVSFNHAAPYWLDVEQFCVIFESDWCKLSLPVMSEAIALYGGDFLTGFYVSNAPAFEDWMIDQRDRLHRLAVCGLSHFAEHALAEGAYQQGLAATQRLLQLEPWSEKAHQLQMLLLGAVGERDRALIQYESCRRVLASEFGVEPAAKTESIYTRLKAGLLDSSWRDQQARAVGAGIVRTENVPPAAVLQPTLVRMELPDQALVYGREKEAYCLYNWIAGERCRLVTLTGRVGIGKTALAHSVAQLLLQPVDRVLPGASPTSTGCEQILWYSLREMRSPDQLFDDWLDLSGSSIEATGKAEREALLVEQLRRRRCLLVLDDIERLTDPSIAAIWATPFWRLIEGIVYSEHQSCLLLIGRELPPPGTYFEVTSNLVRSLCLGGLSFEAIHMLLAPYGLNGSPTIQSRLIEQYDGTPLFLHLAARTIQSLFHGNIEAFCSAGAPLLDVIRTILDAEFAALELIEQDIIALLATAPRPVSFQQLHQTLHHRPTAADLLDALQRLQRRSLLLAAAEGFMLPRLLQIYARARARVDLYHQEPRAICLLQPS